MRTLVYALLFLLLVSAMACQKDPYPYISLAAAKKIDSLVHPAITNAAFIYQNNVYYVADFTKPVTQVTTDGSAIKFVKMSHDHSKFAYLNGGGRIMIVNNKGTIITTLGQYSQVASFDWSTDDKTLYILNNNVMVYYGTAMNLPAFTHPGIINGSTIEILSASVSMLGDFAYVVHGYNFIDGDKYELIIAPANKGTLIEYDNPENDVNTMDYVSFSTNLQDLVVGYGTPNSQQSLDTFTGLKSFPDFTSNGNFSATPVYNSTLNYMVAGSIDQNNNNAIEPAAIYLGPTPVDVAANVAKTILLSKYSTPNGTLYSDWK